jgi:ABC-type phosphate transport system substrate-binding protein
MNKSRRILISAIALAMIAFSAATGVMTHASEPTGLVNPNTLTIAGSSTIYPIAYEEAGYFPSYWNNLNAANPGWGASNITQPINVAGLGSGTAIPALANGEADIGEMSRPPQNSSAEWLNVNMTTMQIWAIGIDSVAIVLSPDMTWFPTNLTTLQVAQLFADTAASNYTTPCYTTWGAFLTDYYGNLSQPIPSYINSTELNEPINRAVRDPTSGTFDCFNNYFAVPNNYQFEHKTNGVVDNSQEMAPYTYCEENLNIFNTVSNGNLASGTDYIGFISLGYLETYGHMIGLNIAYNMANPPASVITYVTPYSWGPYVTPNRANVIYGVSGVQGVGATGQYMAWRWLWEVTPGQIPSTGPLLETGVWIAYMRKPGTTILNGTSSDFVNDQSYIELNQADIAGGQVLNSALQPYSPLPGQTQTIPTGKVSGTDFFYFVDAYIHYYANGIYNPYADLNADGKIDGSDFLAFASAYVAYFTTYNPTL